MAKVSKRFLERAKANLRRYQKILEHARARDVNESDTVVIVTDFLADVLGYDKYEDVTREVAVRATFVDLAIKREGQLQFLIEVKSAGAELRDTHLQQALNYGANQGVEWILLTNGIEWQAHRIRFEQPIATDLVFTLNLLDPAAKPAQLMERLFLISKEAGGDTELGKFFKHQEATSRFVVAQVLLAPPTLALVRRQLRMLFPGLAVDETHLSELLRTEVLKRDVLDGEKAAAAVKVVKRLARKRRSGTVAGKVDAQPAVPGIQLMGETLPLPLEDPNAMNTTAASD